MASKFLLSASFLTQVISAQEYSYVYLHNTDYIANASNVVEASWADLAVAFQTPSETNSAAYSGFDWTKPFPGTPLKGFGAHLRIVNDTPFSNTTVYNQSTEVTAITSSIPDLLMGSDGVPLDMDSSWYICQHYLVSTLPDPTHPNDESCGFLPEQCQADLKADLTTPWGKLDLTIPCSGLALDTIPNSCEENLGMIHADVLGWGSRDFADADTAKLLTVDEVGQESWMIGTGYVDAGIETTYYAASNRTYLVVTVFGYNTNISTAKVETPVAELACLRPSWKASTVSMTITSATNPSTMSSSKTSSTTSTMSATATSIKYFIFSWIILFIILQLKIKSRPTLPFLVHGTTAEGVYANFLGLCRYSCNLIIARQTYAPVHSRHLRRC
ncbi:hypothetical protein OCU04_012778 [Sclerotinia nivalis]|uniref:Peptidase A1 domain-containing protein n=1 Tax=Sclerotinia nivalis TaxID=352851 RepID=A0A9X0A9F0_9HELO|nr:hypothetical protein OCU04_012778 [Sclerotinia nivalis]